MSLMTVRAHNGIPPLRYSLNGCYQNCSEVMNIDEATGTIYTTFVISFLLNLFFDNNSGYQPVVLRVNFFKKPAQL